MRVSVITIGCKVNQYESDSLVRALIHRGINAVEGFVPADTYIINTCAVTAEAERKSRQCVTRVRKLNPNAVVYITGCASERNAEQFMGKEGVIYVSGTAGKTRLKQFQELFGVSVPKIPELYEDDFSAEPVRTRSYIKVQDGCNNFCAYCILPYVRGRSRSRGLESVKREFIETAAISPEIVLTGINLSAYGLDIGLSLIDLISAVKGYAKRLRLGSLEAGIIDEEFLKLLSSMPEFCPQFHLSLQSGDDSVLVSMNRRYLTGEFRDKVALIREYFPDAAITTDIIVGYPTEEEENFLNTFNFAREIGFSNIHCFPYSPRKGTSSYNLPVHSKEVLGDRMRRIEAIRDELRNNYNRRFIGHPLKVLIEDREKGYNAGYSENYIRVYIDKITDSGKIIEITPNELLFDGLKG